MRSTSRVRSIEAALWRPGRGRQAVAFLLFACLTLGVWPASAEESGQTHTVAIESMKFTPHTLRVRPGDLVVFENKDIVPHTATAKSGGTFDSGFVAPGKSWTFRPQRPGAIHYACTFHPIMEGEIVVEK